MPNGRLNGNVIWIALVTVIGLFLGLHYQQNATVTAAKECAEAAKDTADRVETTEALHYLYLREDLAEIKELIKNGE